MPLDRRYEVVTALVEGMSVRATARLKGVSKPTILKLIEDLGLTAAIFLDQSLRNLPCRRIQADEIWEFCYARKANIAPEWKGQFGYGDIYTWVAMNPDTKLIVSWLVGDRSARSANQFMKDVASRLLYRVQFTTDGYEPYVEAVYGAFGEAVHYSMVVKDFGVGRSEKRVVSGNPEPRHMSTSLIERQNRTIRMGMRRYTRKTNGFSKKVENHVFMLAIFYLY